MQIFLAFYPLMSRNDETFMNNLITFIPKHDISWIICSIFVVFNCDIITSIFCSDNLSACLNIFETYNVTSYTSSNNHAVKFMSLIKAPDIKHQIELNIWKSNMKVKHEVFTCSTGAQRNPHTFVNYQALGCFRVGNSPVSVGILSFIIKLYEHIFLRIGENFKHHRFFTIWKLHFT